MKKILFAIATVALLSACSLSFSMDIFSAIYFEDINRIRELIEVEGVDVNNVTDQDGNTPLCYAYKSISNLEIIKLIFDKCTIDTINKANNHNWTALHNACYSNNLAKVQLLIPKCTINTINKKTQDYFTPLSLALRDERLDVIRLLLANGANITGDVLYTTNDWIAYFYIHQNKFKIRKLLDFAQDLDDNNNKFKFINNQTDPEIVDMLSQRLYKKYGIKYKQSLDLLKCPRGLQKYSDCNIRTVGDQD